MNEHREQINRVHLSRETHAFPDGKLHENEASPVLPPGSKRNLPPVNPEMMLGVEVGMEQVGVATPDCRVRFL